MLRSRRTDPGAPVRSTTGRVLRGQRTWLLVLAVAVLVAAVTVLYPGYTTAAGLQQRAKQAVTEVAAARRALVQADGDAASSFGEASVQLTGPGTDYLGQITLASQSLEQVAEANEGGTAASQTLQLLGSLISTYTGEIQQAAAAYAAGQNTLGAATAWYASDFLHADTDGILAELTTLDDEQATGLHEAAYSFWVDPWNVLVWAVPALLLLALLVRTQVYAHRRFRRSLNPLLAAATVLALGVVVAGPVFAIMADHELTDSVATLATVRQDDVRASAAIDIDGQEALFALVSGVCTDGGSGCGTTLDRVQQRMRQPHPDVGADTPDTAVVQRATAEQSRAVATELGLVIGLGACAVACGILVLAGMWPRINEYRYRT